MLLTIGHRLIALRKARDLTQEEAAELLGVDVRILRRIEAGSIDIRISRLCRFANRYQVPVQSLLKPLEASALAESGRRAGRPKKAASKNAGWAEKPSAVHAVAEGSAKPRARRRTT